MERSMEMRMETGGRIMRAARWGITFSCSVVIASLTASGAALPNRQRDTVETSRGSMTITPLYHGSVMVEFAGKVIHIDRWSQADYRGIPQADMILITHTHADPMDPTVLKTLRKDSTVVVTSEAVNDTLNGCCGTRKRCVTARRRRSSVSGLKPSPYTT